MPMRVPTYERNGSKRPCGWMNPLRVAGHHGVVSIPSSPFMATRVPEADCTGVERLSGFFAPQNQALTELFWRRGVRRNDLRG
jgi:hypothetical protein